VGFIPEYFFQEFPRRSFHFSKAVSLCVCPLLQGRVVRLLNCSVINQRLFSVEYPIIEFHHFPMRLAAVKSRPSFKQSVKTPLHQPKSKYLAGGDGFYFLREKGNPRKAIRRIFKNQCLGPAKRAEIIFRNSLAARPGGRCFGQIVAILRAGLGACNGRYTGASVRSCCAAIAGIREMPRPACTSD